MKVASILQDLVFNPDKVLIKVLFETNFTKEIRICMHAGTILKEHKAPFPIVVELVAGKIEFGVAGKTQSLQQGDLLALDAYVPHDLRAKEESIIRLTLSKADEAERVKSIV